jgi:AcrR family transcriptional regulator
MKNNPRKEQILRTSQKRFVKHGLSKTTIEEIARDLRIGKATVYHYFSSKEEIFYEVISGEIDKYLEEIKETLYKDESDFLDRITGYINIKENLNEKYPLISQLLLHFFKEQALEKDFEIQNILIEKEANLLSEFLKITFNKKTIDMLICRFLVYQTWSFVLIQKLNPGLKFSDQHFLSVFFTRLYNLFLI